MKHLPTDYTLSRANPVPHEPGKQITDHITANKSYWKECVGNPPVLSLCAGLYSKSRDTQVGFSIGGPKGNALCVPYTICTPVDDYGAN